MSSIVKSIFSWRKSGRGRELAAIELGGVGLTARMARDWGAAAVRRPLDRTNVGPYMGMGPTQ